MKLKSLRKKLTKNYFSCGDLRIYPIREIRGTNRILYGDKYDNGDWFEESQDGFYHQPRDKPSDDEYSKSSPKTSYEPVYSEILPLSRSCECLVNISSKSDNTRSRYENTPIICDRVGPWYEKLYHFYSSHPSLKSDSCDSGYRSVSQVPIRSCADQWLMTISRSLIMKIIFKDCFFSYEKVSESEIAKCLQISFGIWHGPCMIWWARHPDMGFCVSLIDRLAIWCLPPLTITDHTPLPCVWISPGSQHSPLWCDQAQAAVESRLQNKRRTLQA